MNTHFVDQKIIHKAPQSLSCPNHASRGIGNVYELAGLLVANIMPSSGSDELNGDELNGTGSILSNARGRAGQDTRKSELRLPTAFPLLFPHGLEVDPPLQLDWLEHEDGIGTALSRGIRPAF